MTLKAFSWHKLNQDVKLIVSIAFFFPFGTYSYKIQILYYAWMVQLSPNIKFGEATYKSFFTLILIFENFDYFIYTYKFLAV